jgi:SsrA-binding protein
MATLLENKKATFNYEILEKFEAGIELFGYEVKSLRGRRGSLRGAYVGIRGNEAFLLGSDIPPYQPANVGEGYDPRRARRLLLSKDELKTLIGKEKTKGLTLIPLSVYTKGRYIKVGVAVVRGKKKFDKRESIKRRDTEREVRRSLKKHFNL